jgi:hypothetical protein
VGPEQQKLETTAETLIEKEMPAITIAASRTPMIVNPTSPFVTTTATAQPETPASAQSTQAAQQKSATTQQKQSRATTTKKPGEVGASVDNGIWDVGPAGGKPGSSSGNANQRGN